MPPGSIGAAALGSGISGALGIVGSAINYGFNKILAAQQNQYNIDMWKMQADYNSPQQQMQRFAQAGLNPNLIYGQGSNGNMSQAPQLVTPLAPDVSKDMRELGKAFNIENLRTIVANRKKAESDADSADSVARQQNIAAKEAEDSYEAKAQFHHDYVFDPKTGSFVLVPRSDTRELTGAVSNYYLQHMLADNYYKGHLIPFRQALLLGEKNLIPFRQALLREQKNLLVPQVYMRNFDKDRYHDTFYIDRANKPAGAVYGIWTGLKNFLGF